MSAIIWKEKKHNRIVRKLELEVENSTKDALGNIFLPVESFIMIFFWV